MSGQFAPLSNGVPPLPHHPPPQHAQTKPEGAWCRCGKPRESCVSTETRKFWQPIIAETATPDRTPNLHLSSQ